MTIVSGNDFDDDNLKGGSGADIISGGGGDDFLQGKAGGDTLDGGAGDDMLHGDAGDDILIGGQGDDFIHGGLGTDTAVYSGSVLEYSFSTDGENLHVSHTGGSQIDGNDRLLHVERLRFSDIVIDLGQNNAPLAFDDVASTNEDASVSGNVLTNDFDWEGDTLTATPGTFNGVYGTLVLNANGTFTYTPHASSQSLAQGQVVQDTFTYTVSDGSLTDTGTLTIDLSGNNDAPTANPDTAMTGENATVTVDVLANDTDVDNGAVLTVTDASAPAGQGSAFVIGNQVQFDPGTDFDYLDTGESAIVAVSYTISDEFGATSSSTVTITVNGANDAPVANDDTATTDENSSVSGNVLANDTDVDGETLTVANPATFIGAYGTLVLSANGNYTYTPGAAAQALNNGQTANDVFTYIASDGTASDTATLTITVTGLSGVPDAVDDTASTTEDASVSGNVLANDTDAENDPLTVTNPGTYAGAYGTLTLAADGSYTYAPNAAANGLAAGEVAQDVFSYTASDGTASDTATLTVTVNGTNDAPTIDAGGTDASGSVAELPDGDPGEGTTIHTDSGTIAFDDVDLADTHSATFTPQGGGYFGTFTLDPVNQAGDSVGWNFSVPDAQLEGLSEGEIRTQTYTVEIDDGQGGTVTQDVTITITGAGVGAGPQTVWYIDNSAVGSANVGTQADPYTSIAAFNAAQGTLGGPQVGHTVYLLAGLGTYAEADGINLIAGQTLIGLADGALRPTIVTTAGDGINVAQNNNVSGIDIGDTSGAGIADSGGSVGTLIVSDVGISGTGQIADIDQGGTLSVTLNAASSLGSTGGAIDLAGVGGTFTVTGATTIAGVHSGGGIDITGSSVTATFAGGGAVSTADTTAVNFVGNSGSLTLGGGFAIATTSGTGFNATGGGTVTVQGSGNTIDAIGSGTALNVANVTIGAPGLTFESISAGTAVGTAGVGISLVNTGSVGGLTVTGTGTAGSGGTIQNKTGADGSTTGGIGIYLENTSAVSLNEMDLHDFDNHGIFGQSVNGIRVTNTTIGGAIGTSTSSNDAAVAFGTAGATNGFADNSSSLFDNVDVSGGIEHVFEIYQQSGTFHLTITGSTIRDNHAVSGADGLHIETGGTAHGIIRVDTTTFDNNGSQAVQATALGSSHLELTLHGNTVLASTRGNEGFVLQNGASGDLTVAVTDNNFTGVLGTNILVGSVANNATSSAELNATISGNVMTLDAPATGRTLVAFFSSTNGQVSTARVTIDNNVINTIADPEAGLGEPIFVTTPDAGTDPLVYVTVSNNVVNIDDDNQLAGRGIVVQSLQNVSTMHADVRGNEVNYLDGAPAGVVGIRVRQANPATLDLEPGAGGATAAEVLANNNPLSTTQILGTVTVSADDNVVLPPSTPATPSLPAFMIAGFDAGLLPASPAGLGEPGLSQSELDRLVDAAIDRLSNAGATAEQVAAMRAVEFTVADLIGRHLGASEGGRVVLDSDGAGYGWFVDTTPGDDSEFGGSGTRLIADPAGAAAGRIDALTVVLHELGHQLGLADDHHAAAGTELMHGYLDSGERRLPEGLFETVDAMPAWTEWAAMPLHPAEMALHYPDMSI